MNLKKCLLLIVAVFMIGTSQSLFGQTLISHDFNDGNLSPFNACSVKNPNYTIVENGRVKTFWTQSGYDGSRSTRGAEFCGDAVVVRKHGWYGITVNLGADYQTDKQAGIGQVFQFSSPTFWSWVVMLDMTAGDLTMTHRGPSPGAKTDVVLYPNFPKETDMNIIIGFTLSGIGNGEIQVWVNEVSVYHATNISLGFGTWDENDEQTGEHTFVTFKAGQYNFNAANYSSGDTETVYYDNVSWYNGANGYDLVNPSNVANCSGSNIALCGTASQSSTGYGGDASRAIDGNTNGAWSGGSVTHTNTEANPWWEVALDGTYDIGDINIFNRTDACCKARLTNFTVTVLDGTSTTFSQSFTAYPDPSITVDAGGATGNIVRVQLDDTNPLSLAEVEVFEGASSCPTFSTIQAENYTSMSGIVNEGTNIGYIHNGDWAMYSNIDLTCATGIDIRASSQTSGGTIEVRLGSPTGTQIGTVNVTGTGNWGNYTTFSAGVSGTSGVQDVYLVFTGGSGYLFNIDWLTFSDGAGARGADAIAEEFTETQFRVFPNPVVDKLQVTVEDSWFNRFTVYNIDGRVMRHGTIERQAQDFSIDVSDLESGVYLLTLKGVESEKTIKLIKQ